MCVCVCILWENFCFNCTHTHTYTCTISYLKSLICTCQDKLLHKYMYTPYMVITSYNNILQCIWCVCVCVCVCVWVCVCVVYPPQPTPIPTTETIQQPHTPHHSYIIHNALSTHSTSSFNTWFSELTTTTTDTSASGSTGPPLTGYVAFLGEFVI